MLFAANEELKAVLRCVDVLGEVLRRASSSDSRSGQRCSELSTRARLTVHVAVMLVGEDERNAGPCG